MVTEMIIMVIVVILAIEMIGEKVVAKKDLFGWKVREEIKYADVSEMQE